MSYSKLVRGPSRWQAQARHEMSRYSTPRAYRALVAGPLKNGEVVASWRNTSRNSFSAGVRIAMVTAPVALLSPLGPLVAPAAESSSSHTGAPFFRRLSSLVLWGKDAFGDQPFADGDGARVIDIQHLDRRSPDGRSAEEYGAAPPEMSRPRIPPRVKEANHSARGGISTGYIRSLICITPQAGEGKVLGDRLPAVLAVDDVIDGKAQAEGGLGYPAVLAPLVGTLTNPAVKRPIHAGSRTEAGTPERQTCLRLQEGEQVRDAQIFAQFLLLVRG
jgi:hypothetical protein